MRAGEQNRPSNKGSSFEPPETEVHRTNAEKKVANASVFLNINYLRSEFISLGVYSNL